jgi:hypothetical protein
MHAAVNSTADGARPFATTFIAAPQSPAQFLAADRFQIFRKYRTSTFSRLSRRTVPKSANYELRHWIHSSQPLYVSTCRTFVEVTGAGLNKDL